MKCSAEYGKPESQIFQIEFYCTAVFTEVDDEIRCKTDWTIWQQRSRRIICLCYR